MRKLIRRLWPMPGDFIKRHGRHRGRPALVARRREHQGATAYWSPWQEIHDAEAAREPEELLAEAAQREADERVQHLADLDRSAEEQTAAEFETAWSNAGMEALAAAVNDACRGVLEELGLSDAEAGQLLARYRSAAEPTGGWPTVRLAVTR